MAEGLSSMVLPYRRILTLTVAALFATVIGALFGLMTLPVWINFSPYATIVCLVTFAASFLYFGRGAIIAGFISGAYLGFNSKVFDVFFVGVMLASALAMFAGIWLGHVTYKDLLEHEISPAEVSIGFAILFFAIFIAIGVDLVYL